MVPAPRRGPRAAPGCVRPFAGRLPAPRRLCCRRGPPGRFCRPGRRRRLPPGRVRRRFFAGAGFWAGSAPVASLRWAAASGARVSWCAVVPWPRPWPARLLRRSLAALAGCRLAVFFLASPSLAVRSASLPLPCPPVVPCWSFAPPSRPPWPASVPVPGFRPSWPALRAGPGFPRRLPCSPRFSKSLLQEKIRDAKPNPNSIPYDRGRNPQPISRPGQES